MENSLWKSLIDLWMSMAELTVSNDGFGERHGLYVCVHVLHPRRHPRHQISYVIQWRSEAREPDLLRPLLEEVNFVQSARAWTLDAALGPLSAAEPFSFPYVITMIEFSNTFDSSLLVINAKNLVCQEWQVTCLRPPEVARGL